MKPRIPTSRKTIPKSCAARCTSVRSPGPFPPSLRIDPPLSSGMSSARTFPGAAKANGSSRRGEEREHLEARIRRHERRDAGRVVCGRDLDAVEAAEVEADERAKVRERLAAGRPADLGRSGAWRKRRIDEVDVEGEEARAAPDAVSDPLREAAGAARGELLVREGVDPELGRERRV